MKKLMIGNEAIARGAWEAGVTVVSSYPGTPSTEITEFLSKYDELHSEWAPNEKVATEVASGASIRGARALTAMKHVGLNVAADPVFTMSYIGVNGGMVICVADDPGMHSSQNEQDSRNYAIASKIPMLEPADSAECKEFTKLAFDISEQFDTPVFVRVTTRVAHSQSVTELCERQEVATKPYVKDIPKNAMIPAMARPKHTMVEKRTKMLSEYAETSPLNRAEYADTKIGVITSGITYQYVKEALPEASVLKLGMAWPLPKKLIAEFASKVEKLYIVEELDPVLEKEINNMGIKAQGKELFTMEGEYSVALIKEKILGIKNEDTIVPDKNAVVRPPALCPGCSHRGVFYILHKLGVTVSGDIGCYALGCAAPLESVDTIICMGASVSALHGMEMADKEFARKSVAVIGDSTFMHSGITGLINSVYNKGTSTTIILDNSITGMTGHQNNPANGLTIKGEPTKQVDLELLAKAVGVERVVVADPFDLENFEKVLKEELAAEEVSVIIAQRPCALIKKAGYKGRYVITDDCKNCKMCMKLACPAISIAGGKPQIDETLCVGCGLCPSVCKFGAIKKAE